MPKDIPLDQIPRKIIQSEAWPEKLRSQYSVAEIHNFLNTENVDIAIEDISFRLVGSEHIDEIKILHEEWFPIHYNDEYFSNLKSKEDAICMGAFYKETYLVGIFIGMFKYNSFLLKQLTRKSWFSWSNIWGLYIATIGVIDEVRRLGIGSKLVETVIDWTKLHKPQWEVIYLHVIDYNQAAIRFYEKNNFENYGRYQGYYFIADEFYDSYLFFKRLWPPSWQTTKRPRHKTRSWNIFGRLFQVIFGPSTEKDNEDIIEDNLGDLEISNLHMEKTNNN